MNGVTIRTRRKGDKVAPVFVSKLWRFVALSQRIINI
ncbi:Uncharacterised protein [Vibrio cholerae]|nr:Uncharacterised protein [Vibrio cholerae]